VKLLAIETATDACSVALWVDGDCLERHEVAPRRHAELVLAQVEAVLAEAGLGLAGLDCIAFGRGPGSFTGLRVASGLVQGLALGAGLGVVPVSTLRTVAQGAAAAGAARALVAFDARMEEVYLGAFVRGADGLMAEVAAERVCAPGAVDISLAGPWVGLGDGWAVHGDALHAALEETVDVATEGHLPRARFVADLAVPEARRGALVAARDALPVYLRDRVARKPAGRRAHGALPGGPRPVRGGQPGDR
jgi:tRNA threonylcarbamoyladenosine biosynthesis protein TsaB